MATPTTVVSVLPENISRSRRLSRRAGTRGSARVKTRGSLNESERHAAVRGLKATAQWGNAKQMRYTGWPLLEIWFLWEPADT